MLMFPYKSLLEICRLLNPILHGGGGAWIPPLLTLVLNSVSGIQAIVLMFGDFS